MERNKPCLCISCPDCGAVFSAKAIRPDYLIDSESNFETLRDAGRYFTDGFNVSVKDASDFKIDYCDHLKQYKDS